MAKPLKVRIEVDTREVTRKFKEAHRAAEDFADALQVLREEIKIGVRVVRIADKKWWQFWK